MIWILAPIGGYLIWDGIYSIILYHKQKWYEHIIRIVRTILGISIVILGVVY